LLLSNATPATTRRVYLHRLRALTTTRSRESINDVSQAVLMRSGRPPAVGVNAQHQQSCRLLKLPLRPPRPAALSCRLPWTSAFPPSPDRRLRALRRRSSRRDRTRSALWRTIGFAPIQAPGQYPVGGRAGSVVGAAFQGRGRGQTGRCNWPEIKRNPVAWVSVRSLLDGSREPTRGKAHGIFPGVITRIPQAGPPVRAGRGALMAARWRRMR
jgi:hypothetical protein